ncbi:MULTISPECIES: hypothetical protein [Chelativorans]|nr:MULTISPECIES: hypothetical protein [Chelativorans]
MVETLERVAKRRRGHIGDIKSSDTAPSGDAPPIPSEDPTMEAIWNAAPDLSKIPDDIALDIQSLDWESRHRMAIELREWAASAAEWVMPELKMGRLE